jgi:hypothetical protein
MQAKVGIRAGRYRQTLVDVNLLGSSTGTHIVNATVHPRELEADWAVIPALDMMTDVMRQLYILNATGQYQKNNIEGFVRGSLKLGYDATWSALPNMVDDSQEEIRIVPLESAIRAEVNKARLYGWLAMNVTQQIAAALVAIAHWVRAPGQRMTRDPTLMALMMDLDDVKYCGGDGLCNAVALSSRDKKLGRMK